MLSLLLAKKLFFPFSHTHTWNKLALLATSTIALSIAALSIAGALLEAFHKETLATFQNIQSDMSVSLKQEIKTSKLLPHIEQAKLFGLIAYEYGSEMPVIVANPEHHKFATATLINKNLTNSQIYRLPKHETSNYYQITTDSSVVIGIELARDINVQVGDAILICTAELFENPEDLDLDKNTVIIEKILESGVDELDSSYIFCNDPTFSQISRQNQPNRLDIKLSPNAMPNKIKNIFQQALGLPFYEWIDLYPTLKSALSLELSIFFLVLLLVIAIIVLSLPSLLTLLIEQKKGSISILLVSGIPLLSIRRALLIFGLSLIGFAQATGIAIAYVSCFVINNVCKIPLPANYYHAHLTIEISSITTLIILIASSILGGLVVWCTARALSYQKISYFLKKGL